MNRPMLLLAALCSLAVFFGWKTREAWYAPPPAVDNSGRSSAGAWNSGQSSPDPAPPPETAAAVAAIAARPLFRPERVPFRDDAAGIGRNYDAELSRLSLIGVLTFGESLKGLVVAKGSPRSERWEVGKGDTLQGFQVKEVTADGLSVTADGRVFLLPLYAGGPTAAPGSIRTEVPKTAPPQAAGSVPRPAPPQPNASAPQPQAGEAAAAAPDASPSRGRPAFQPRQRTPRPTYVPGSR